MTWRLGHRPALDGLRGVAILLVLLQHAAVPGLRNAGGVGVSLFFALSGFLITTLLLEERADTGQISLKRFYIRRVRRLAPAYLASAFVVAVLGLAIGQARWTSPSALTAATFYVSNWWQAFSSHTMGVLAGTWSLSVEEQFYLLWPLLVILAGRRTAALAGTLLAASLATRILLIVTGASHARIYLGTDTNATALLVGALLATWFLGRGAGRLPAGAAALGGLGLLGVSVAPVVWVWTGPLVAVSAVPLIYLAATTTRTSPAVLRWLGRRSYSIYLWNSVIAAALFNADLTWPARAIATVVPALLLAEASWRWVEQPFRSRQVEPQQGHAAHAGVGVHAAQPYPV